MPTEPPPDEAAGSFLPFATAALDCHRALNLPAAQAPATRAEIDALHAHVLALYRLAESHTARTGPVTQTEGEHLRALRVRLWQAADHLHDAFHTAPHPNGRLPAREECRSRLPEGAPDLTICQRHLTLAARVRRDHTPADLYDPVTGLTRH